MQTKREKKNNDKNKKTKTNDFASALLDLT